MCKTQQLGHYVTYDVTECILNGLAGRFYVEQDLGRQEKRPSPTEFEMTDKGSLVKQAQYTDAVVVVSAAVFVAVFAAIGEAPGIATTRAYWAVPLAFTATASDAASGKAQCLAFEAVSVLAEDDVLAAVSRVAPVRAAVSAAATATRVTTRKAMEGAGMENGQSSAKSRNCKALAMVARVTAVILNDINGAFGRMGQYGPDFRIGRMEARDQRRSRISTQRQTHEE